MHGLEGFNQQLLFVKRQGVNNPFESMNCSNFSRAANVRVCMKVVRNVSGVLLVSLLLTLNILRTLF